MPISARDALLGLATPFTTALLLTAGAALFRRKLIVQKLAAPVAVTCGFLLGYWLLPLGAIAPKLDRDWLPYTAVLALAPAAAFGRGWLARFFQLGLLCVAVGTAAAKLTPTWPGLTPSRTVHLTVWSVYTAVLAGGLMWIARVPLRRDTAVRVTENTAKSPADTTRGDAPNRVDTAAHASGFGPQIWLATMIAAFATATGVLALSGSLRFAQVATAAMAAFMGLAAGLRICKQPCIDIQGAAIVYALLSSGAMLTGKVNSFSNIPTVSYLLLPLAPLAFLGSGLEGPTRRILLAAGVALGICGLAIGLALAAEFGGA